ncbi:Hypothetical protein HVR_LOCUS128 [uncultured virus]|nr:Hypothetical protein HVR_LOCUS128 [uncultured virus]
MKVTIVGAGPVGLLLSILLSKEHIVTILEKRKEDGRDHGLSISGNTVNTVLNYLNSLYPENACVTMNNTMQQFRDLLLSWSDTPVSTVEIQHRLTEIAKESGVTINYGAAVESINIITDSIIIGADGAHSVIRNVVFGDMKADEHNVQYMAQLKYITSGSARPRKLISAMSYSFLNGLSGSDMVIDFESLAPANFNNALTKPGTLHIPIPESVYDLLSVNGRGKYGTHWYPEELKDIGNYQIAKLYRIIRRYQFSLNMRGGTMSDPKITVLPLTIYRSTDVVKILPLNKVVMLCGDSSSGLIYELGLNKGWLEAVQCAMALENVNSSTLAERLVRYAQFCQNLYEIKRDEILAKHNKIMSVNKSTSTTGIVLTSGLGILLSRIFGGSIVSS